MEPVFVKEKAVSLANLILKLHIHSKRYSLNTEMLMIAKSFLLLKVLCTERPTLIEKSHSTQSFPFLLIDYRI